MNNYCSKCDKIYYDEEFNYCPICSAKLEEIDKDIYQIKGFIEGYSSEKSMFKIDEEKRIVKFKWNDRWISESIDKIIANEHIRSTPPHPNFFELVTTIKDKWDKKLENDLPDYNKKLTFNQVERCEVIMRVSYETGRKVWPRFAASVNIKELLQDLIYQRIYNFEEIKRNELYLVLLYKE